MSSYSQVVAKVPNCGSSDVEWIEFHKEAKKYFGASDAKVLWQKVWEKRSDESGVFTSDKANTSTLRDYAEKNGLSVQASTLAGIGDGIGDFFGMFGTVIKTFALIFVVFLVLILVAILMAIFKGVKDPEYINKAAGSVAAAKGKLK